MRGARIEATRPSAQDIEALRRPRRARHAGLSQRIPTRPQEDVVGQAALVRAAGLEPVPHLAVRNFASADALTPFSRPA